MDSNDENLVFRCHQCNPVLLDSHPHQDHATGLAMQPIPTVLGLIMSLLIAIYHRTEPKEPETPRTRDQDYSRPKQPPNSSPSARSRFVGCVGGRRSTTLTSCPVSIASTKLTLTNTLILDGTTANRSTKDRNKFKKC
jgi:hypothetical protein